MRNWIAVVAGIVIAAAGVLSLSTSAISFERRESSEAKLGPVELKVSYPSQKRIPIPKAASWGAIAGGAALAGWGLVPRRRRG